MPTSIQIEISPIEEATIAILDTIKAFFLAELDDKFISTQIEIDLDDYLENMRDGLFCVIEYPYVDKVYRDSYYNYYSSKHYSYQRDCIRVSLFESEIKSEHFLNPECHLDLNRKYLGYFIIRPTINALFGRSIINPKAFEENSCKICTCKINSLVYGVKLETEGFPHSSQDGETIKCAETTIWGLMEYFGNKYAEYKPTLPSKIHEAIARFSYQRQLPSIGLAMDQISFALKEFGFGTEVYSYSTYRNDIYNIIDNYIESGIPVIVGLQSDEIGHAIIAIGKQYIEISDWKNIKKSCFNAWGKEHEYFDASNIPAKYIVQDDNMDPYCIISLDKPGEHYEDERSKYKIDTVVVPLYPKIYLETVVAKNLALEIIKDKFVGFEFGSDFVFRFYLSSSRSFKNHIAIQKDMDVQLKNNLLITKMPKFIWCAEFYRNNIFKCEGSKGDKGE